MSKIVDFRQRIIDTVKAMYPDMDVEWYDGLFDEHDIAEWTLKTPCARVAVMNSTGDHEATGELNARLRCLIVIIDENRYAALDGDARAWEYVESIAIMANLNQFGDPNAAPATNVKFRRISQPVLRREGVSVGVVEWESDLTIGHNRIAEREYFYRPDGSRITQLPLTAHTRGHVHTAAGVVSDETTDFDVER
ncbi:hypothetical protein FXV83_16455 [Bradyrhizobium hipponense]|uniref:Uncharacterized protein n=1 Tax=Bradyrhizobium hipponense TaxID=2605638 RepID=A0A5S4YNQ7_9BRAD|nr:hypothetical protein [Bradyrhizobium hipponense]TYO65522.1 hypothetical protein FXV83_16455 [Bradyrhizobium hipponense]